MSSNRPTYMPQGDNDYIDWEGNILSTYPTYLGLFGEEVQTQEQLDEKILGHGQLVQVRDAAAHAEEYRHTLTGLRGQLIDGPEQTRQVTKPDPGMELGFTASLGGHVKQYTAWVKAIKASPKYNPAIHGILFRIETGPLPAPDYLNMESTGYTEWDWLRPFRTIPRGADGYNIHFDMGDGKEELKGSSGLGHGWVKAPALPGNGLLMFKLITRLTHQGKEVGRPTWQILNLQKDLPARFGVLVENKKGTPEL